jgi:3'(2'), 5'-bisphosphate nucleotidase
MTSFADSDLASPTDGPLADAMTTLVSRAAAAVMAIDLSAVATRMKADRSPVTAADHAAQSVIMDGLSRFLPGVPVVSEEANPAEMTIDKDATFILLDPLDGTREYLAGRPEFTINLAIVRRGIPVFGCISAPALGLPAMAPSGSRFHPAPTPARAGTGSQSRHDRWRNLPWSRSAVRISKPIPRACWRIFPMRSVSPMGPP